MLGGRQISEVAVPHIYKLVEIYNMGVAVLGPRSQSPSVSCVREAGLPCSLSFAGRGEIRPIGRISP